MILNTSQPHSLAVTANQFPFIVKPIRILIAEDQRFVADALDSLLSRQPGMLIVGTTGPAGDSMVLIRALQPDVVLLKFRLSSESIETAAAIREMFPAAKVIFLTDVETESVILAAIEHGVGAVLSMSTAADDVIRAVRVVAGGGSLMTPAAIASALQRRRTTDGLRDRLTSREREVLNLMSDGSSNREIALAMGISYGTVRTHLSHVSSKLAAHSKLEVLLTAQRLDLVGGPPPGRAARDDEPWRKDFAADEMTPTRDGVALLAKAGR